VAAGNPQSRLKVIHRHRVGRFAFLRVVPGVPNIYYYRGTTLDPRYAAADE
jgi:hypothetical protein